jgi:predicted KAP-like P-loop ATPase
MVQKILFTIKSEITYFCNELYNIFLKQGLLKPSVLKSE